MGVIFYKKFKPELKEPWSASNLIRCGRVYWCGCSTSPARQWRSNAFLSSNFWWTGRQWHGRFASRFIDEFVWRGKWQSSLVQWIKRSKAVHWIGINGWWNDWMELSVENWKSLRCLRENSVSIRPVKFNRWQWYRKIYLLISSRFVPNHID